MFIKQLCNLNVSLRIYEILKEHVKQDIQNNEGTNASNSAMMIKAEGVFEIVKNNI